MSTSFANGKRNNEEQKIEVKTNNRSSYVHLFAGALAGTLGAVLTCPLEVIKTRYQSSHSNYFDERFQSGTAILKQRPTIIGSLRSILKYEGMPGLFKGLVPNLIGVAPSRAIYFFAYANTKSFLLKKMERETPLVHVTSAAAAGIAMSTCTNPVWFIKTRLQIDRKNRRAIDVIRNVYHENGLRGFYKGISASYVGVSETIVHFVIYEYVKVRLQALQTDPKRSMDEPGLFDFLAYLTAGACSKSCATTLCYPHEVIRTRLREEGTKYRTFLQTFRTIYYEESIAGLYRGLLTHLIRQIPNTAIMMSTYELIVAFLLSNPVISSSTATTTKTTTTNSSPKHRLPPINDEELNAMDEIE